MATITVPAGTVLFHGTDAHERFLVPRGPAWFAGDWGTAARWAGWGSKARADRRVLRVALLRPVVLRDTVRERAWRKFCLELCGDPDACIWGVAKEAVKRGLGGWYGGNEVLLADTGLLRHLGQTPVPDGIVPHGR